MDKKALTLLAKINTYITKEGHKEFLGWNDLSSINMTPLYYSLINNQSINLDNSEIMTAVEHSDLGFIKDNSWTVLTVIFVYLNLGQLSFTKKEIDYIIKNSNVNLTISNLLDVVTQTEHNFILGHEAFIYKTKKSIDFLVSYKEKNILLKDSKGIIFSEDRIKKI